MQDASSETSEYPKNLIVLRYGLLVAPPYRAAEALKTE